MNVLVNVKHRAQPISFVQTDVFTNKIRTFDVGRDLNLSFKNRLVISVVRTEHFISSQATFTLSVFGIDNTIYFPFTQQLTVASRTVGVKPIKS